MAIAEFVENANKMVIPSVQPAPAEQPPQEIINDDLNVKIEMNTDKEELITKSEMQNMSTGNIALMWDQACRQHGSQQIVQRKCHQGADRASVIRMGIERRRRD